MVKRRYYLLLDFPQLIAKLYAKDVCRYESLYFRYKLVGLVG